MSLHTLAGHLQSAGRGDDKVLVHMTPKEVDGLQSLAMAHGGSLTINPKTGLPEAGFLSRLLPMIAGLALGPAGLGLTAMQAGLATAAVGTAATGSLGKGLMMGLGAYGGAGVGAGLSSMGQAAAAKTAGATAGTTAGATAGTAAGTTAGTAAGTTGAGTTLFPSSANAAGAQASTFGNLAKGTGPYPSFVPADAGLAAAKPLAFNPAYTGSMAAAPTSTFGAIGQGIPTPPPSAMSALGTGFKEATGSVQGLKDLYSATEAAAPYAGYAGLGSVALGNYYDKLDKAKGLPKDSPGLIRPYTYERSQNPEAYDMGAPIYAESPGSSRERNYFTEKYTALTPYEAPGPEYRRAAEGGVMGLAVGGPVETMSAMNAVGSNMMYPQSQIQAPMYSNPTMQRPVPTNVISQGVDAPVDPYSGEQKFAGGGPTPKQGSGDFKLFGKLLPGEKSSGYQYDYNPQTMQFTQIAGPGGATKPSPMNLMARALGETMNSQTSAPANGTVTGGMAQPVMPSMPALAAQPVYTPPPIPAYETPEQQLGLSGFYPMMEQRLASLGAAQGYAAGGGISHLGDYSDGGRLLKGPGDGVSDSIPAVIGERQPARLADGEFVIPARIVSEIGNGSTEAGARKLYAMMDRVQKARRKTVGKNKVAANTRSEKYLPA